MTSGTAPAVRVSVIVAVFNPGPGFDDLMASLDRQTLAAESFEVLLCDDGSDESTRQRLDEAAASRPNVRVLALPHTGWPGTPRNHGIDAARGTYVFFADHDDRLFDGALAHLCDYADCNRSDVVIGRVVGIGRTIPQRLFRRDVPDAVLGEDPLLDLLTPHKLFRTGFLREHDIRFPDGRVRLEDHLFVMRTYFAARRISILASTPCYGWVKSTGSASSSRIDPVTYFPHLEPVLDLVEANTAPGPLRDDLLRHWYRGKILNRLAGKRLLRYPEHYRTRFLDVVIPLVRERFGAGVDEGLPFPLRIRSALLRAERRDALVELARFEAGLECRVDVTSARWMRGGRLELTVRARFLHDGRDALVFDGEPQADAREDTASSVWRPPAALADELGGSGILDARRDLRRDRLDLVLHDGADGDERRVAGPAVPDWTAATITIDPLKLFGQARPSRGGAITARVRHAGWTFEPPLRASEQVLKELGPSPLLAGRRTQLVRQRGGTVALSREWPAGRVRDLMARAVRHGGPRVRRALARRRRSAGDAAKHHSKTAGPHSPGVVSGASRTSTPPSATDATHTSSEYEGMPS